MNDQTIYNRNRSVTILETLVFFVLSVVSFFVVKLYFGDNYWEYVSSTGFLHLALARELAFSRIHEVLFLIWILMSLFPLFIILLPVIPAITDSSTARIWWYRRAWATYHFMLVWMLIYIQSLIFIDKIFLGDFNDTLAKSDSAMEVMFASMANGYWIIYLPLYRWFLAGGGVEALVIYTFVCSCILILCLSFSKWLFVSLWNMLLRKIMGLVNHEQR